MSNYLDPTEYNVPKCPICGDENYEFIYKDADGNVCGCSECVSIIESSDWWEELAESMKPDPDALYEEWRDRQYEEKYERRKADA